MHAPPEPPPFDPTDLMQALVIGGGVLIAFVILVMMLSRFLNICPPSQILVFSGRKHKLPDGSTVGFKVLHGGRGFRVPLLEQVSKMDVRLYGVEVGVQN